MKTALLIQLVQRLKTHKPEFFVKIQTIAIVLFIALGAVETLAVMDLINVPEKIMIVIGGVMTFLTGAGFVAQLPNKDPDQK